MEDKKLKLKKKDDELTLSPNFSQSPTKSSPKNMVSDKPDTKGAKEPLTSKQEEESAIPLSEMFSDMFDKKEAKVIGKQALALTKSVSKAESRKHVIDTIKEKSQGKAPSKRSSFTNDETQMAAFGLIPVLIGGLLGGTEGAMKGIIAADTGIKTALDIADKNKKASQKDRALDIQEASGKDKAELTKAQIRLTNAKTLKERQGDGKDALSESQAKARIFGSRMAQAEQEFKALDKDFDPAGFFSRGGSLPSSLQSEDRQKFEQGKKNFLNAVLRKESGARISEEELEVGDLQYFPQAGDSKGVLAQKKRNRDLATQIMLDEGQVNLNDPRVMKNFVRTSELQEVDAEILKRGL